MVPGNLLLIVVILRNRSMRETFTNCLICNTAISDMLSTLMFGVVNTTIVLTHTKTEWPFGEFMCKFLYTSGKFLSRN